jgi:hypothetical protein
LIESQGRSSSRWVFVDDAIIAIESMVVKMEEGIDASGRSLRLSHTAAPMLAGTP